MAGFERIIGLGDHVATRAEVSVAPADDDGPATIHFDLTVGMSGGRGMPTPVAARQIAAALMEAADLAEGQDGWASPT